MFLGAPLAKPTFAITKFDDERMLAFGFASVSVETDGERVVDSQDDIIEPGELERAAYDYVLRSRDGGVMHEQMGVARLVESFVATPEKLERLGLPADSLPQGWWVGFKVDDPEVWKRVKSGELRSFSIGGRCQRREVVE